MDHALPPEARNRELADLLHACAQGSQRAFRQLYDETAPQLYAVLLRMLKRKDWAQDVLQEAFVNVWQNAASYDASRGRVSTWLTSIVRYRALDAMRRERRLVPVEDIGLVSDMQQEPDSDDEAGLLSHAERRALDECLERLSDDQRRSVALAYLDGSTHEEISTRLSSPLGTVKSWIRRGLQSLKRCLDA